MRYSESDWEELANNGKVLILTEIQRRLERKRFTVKDGKKADIEGKINQLSKLIDKAEDVINEKLKQDKEQYQLVKPQIDEIKSKAEAFVKQLKQDYPDLIDKAYSTDFSTEDVDIHIHFNYRAK